MSRIRRLGRAASASSRRALYGALLAALLLRWTSTPAAADPASGITLTLSKTHDAPTPVPSNQTFTFTLAYGWSGGAPGTLVITDTLPSDLEVVSTLPAAQVVDNSAVTFTLTGLTATGGAGTVQINARFLRGVTCDGAVACNEASIVVQDDPASLVKSEQVCVTARAQSLWTFTKDLLVGCAIDSEVVWRICIVQPVGASVGGYNMTNPVLKDVVPVGALVTEVQGPWADFVQNGTEVTFTNGPSSVLVTPGYASHIEYVRVTYPSPQFAVGQQVTNSATLTFNTPCDGGTPLQLTASAEVTLCAAHPAGAIGKSLAITTMPTANNPLYVPTFSPGCCAKYWLSYNNVGNVPQAAPFDVVDDVPQELDVKVIRTVVPSWSAVQVDVFTWSGGACSPYAGPGFPLQYAAGMGGQATTFPLPANICKVRWRYASPMPVLGWTRNYLEVCVRTHGFQPPFAPVLAGQDIVNTLTAPDNLPAPISATKTKVVDGVAPRVVASKHFIGSWGQACQLLNAGPFVPGSTVRWRMAVANLGNLDATPCTITDVLPEHLTYVGNPTYRYGPVAGAPTAGAPPCNWMSATVPAQIGGPLTVPSVGATTLTWTFPTLPSRCDGMVDYFVIEFDVRIADSPPAPPGSYPNSFTFAAGNLATPVISNPSALTVNATAQLTLATAVRQAPSGTFGPSATAPAGSPVEFRLRVTNSGNLPLRDICLLDVMPRVGDVHVLSGSATYPVRSSTFDLPASGAVVPSLPGFVPAYNLAGNSKNPTRSIACAGFCGTVDPTNGVPPLTPGTFVPAAPASTFSFTVSGGATVLGPGASVDVLVSATVPPGTPAGSIACDSFGVRAIPVGTTTCLVAESDVACVEAGPPVEVPGRICVRKFHDANADGVWDSGPPLSEPGLPGFTFVVTNADGLVTLLTTAAGGLVCHPAAGLPPGAYTVSELAQPGWTPTTPVTVTANLVPGQTTTFTFGNRRCATSTQAGKLCIHKWNDRNGDGVRQKGEPGIPGWQFVVNFPNGLSTSVVTDASGVVCLTVPAGVYTVVEPPRGGWTPTTPTSQTVTVAAGLAADVYFGNRESLGDLPGRLCIHKFHDANGNGRPDPREPGVAKQTFVVTPRRGKSVTLTTGADGVACTEVPAGTYTVTESPSAVWTPTTPNPTTVVVAPGRTADVWFGNRASRSRPPK